MDFAPIYLLDRFVYRVVDFFHHWYVDGSRSMMHRFVNALAAADTIFAVEITLRHFFEPLYRDYSPVGRVVGVIFRAGRILVGIAAYAVLAIVFLLIYVAWLALPVVILFYAAQNF